MSRSTKDRGFPVLIEFCQHKWSWMRVRNSMKTILRTLSCHSIMEPEDFSTPPWPCPQHPQVLLVLKDNVQQSNLLLTPSELLTLCSSLGLDFILQVSGALNSWEGTMWVLSAILHLQACQVSSKTRVKSPCLWSVTGSQASLLLLLGEIIYPLLVSSSSASKCCHPETYTQNNLRGPEIHSCSKSKSMNCAHQAPWEVPGISLRSFIPWVSSFSFHTLVSSPCWRRQLSPIANDGHYSRDPGVYWIHVVHIPSYKCILALCLCITQTLVLECPFESFLAQS